MDILIVNKTAGNNKVLKCLYALEEIYCSNNQPYKVVMTSSRTDTIRKAYYYSTLHSTKCLVALGGDGTVNSVVNGMFMANKPLLVIPAGSGNDFYRGIRHFKDDTLVDLGIVNKEYFLGILSIGIDALACKKANVIKECNLHFRENPYIKGALAALMEYETFPLRINLASKTINNSFVVASFCNNNYFGSGINLSPKSSVVDGYLDLVLALKMGKVRLAYTFLKLLLGLHEQDKKVTFQKVDKALVTLPHPALYSFDGEEREGSELDISVLKQKLLIKRKIDPQIQKLCDDYE